MVKVGQKLHDARIHKSISLDEISAATKIRPRFLTAIERGEYDKLPSTAYAQGFVRNYASYLGLSQKEILALFRREFDDKKFIKVLPDSMIKNNGFSLSRVHIKRSFIILSLIILSLAGYLGLQYRSAFVPPPLEVNAATGAPAKNSVIITGNTDPDATILINNEAVALNRDGKFSKNLTLFPGKNSVTIKAKNRFGKENSIIKNINIPN